MDDVWVTALLALIPVAVGAGIGFVPTLLLERMRTEAALRTRWDITLHTVCAKFASCTRRIVDIAEEAVPGSTAERRRELETELDKEHRLLQELMAEIRLLGNRETQTAARALVKHTWALRHQAVSGAEQEARPQVLANLLAFYAAARRQLRVADADDLAPLSAPPDLEVVTP